MCVGTLPVVLTQLRALEEEAALLSAGRAASATILAYQQATNMNAASTNELWDLSSFNHLH